MNRAFRQVLLLAALAVVCPRPAAAQAIDPAFRADIERLMTLTGNTESRNVQIANAVSGQVLDGLKRANPNVSERAIALAREVLEAEFTKAFAAPDGLMPRIIESYALQFTREDVQGLIRFYESPLGRKVVDRTPALLQAQAEMAQKWMTDNQARITATLESRLHAEGLTP